MPENGETLFQLVIHQAELIKAREVKRGDYFGDGPTSGQLDALLEALHPVGEASTASASVLFAAFRIAVATEMTWLFPERDPLGEPMTAVLRKVQTFTGSALESVMSEMKPDLEKYANLSIVENAARRHDALHGNKIIWRLVLARFLHRVGRFLGG
ncbi:MAG TPA: hypothetical protein VH369_07820 [Bryobacteraceae bacterium]